MKSSQLKFWNLCLQGLWWLLGLHSAETLEGRLAVPFSYSPVLANSIARRKIRKRIPIRFVFAFKVAFIFVFSFANGGLVGVQPTNVLPSAFVAPPHE